jgi:hypothetical protein
MKKNNYKTKDLDKSYINKIENISFKPIFIMGLQRSGTSILYKILTLTNYFNYVSAYDIIKFDQLLYNHIKGKTQEIKNKLNCLLSKSQKTRGIDKLEINSNFPEEYGFLLAKKSNNSLLNDTNIFYLINLCKKIQWVSNNQRYILLKNPYDFENFLFIKRKLPESKFIFIHRNPINTLSSQIKAMDTLLKEKSIYMEMLSSRYAKIFEKKLLLKYYKQKYSMDSTWRFKNSLNKYVKSTNKFIKNLKCLNNEDYINVNYEKLCTSPESLIYDILVFLDLKKNLNIDYKEFIRPRKSNIVKIVGNNQNLIRKRLSNYLLFLNNQNLIINI